MAKKWHNKNLPGALHFVTANVLNRRRIFQKESYCRAFLRELQRLRTQYECKLIAFVIMLDHIHLILNPRSGDIQTATGLLKELSAKELVSLRRNKLSQRAKRIRCGKRALSHCRCGAVG
jgi:REP element-mobilizing transposase RayT